MALQKATRSSSTRDLTPRNSSQSKNFIFIFITLAFISSIHFFQFRGDAKHLLSYIKQESINEPAPRASNDSRSTSAVSAPLSQPAESQSTTSAPSYEPTYSYMPTESDDDTSNVQGDTGANFQNGTSDRDPLIWESIGDTRGHAAHGLLPMQKCSVIENVCHNMSSKYWFYFQDSEDNGFEPKYKIPHPRQPLFSTRVEKRKTSIHMDSLSLHQNSSWIKEQQCTISPIENHVVLNGDHIHMMGEYIQRIIVPLYHLLEDYAQHSKNNTKSDGEKEMQFYLNFYQNENQKILPSHHVYINGLQYGQDLQSWAETLDPIDTTSSPPCQCYSRLVFCGFKADSKIQEIDVGGSNKTVSKTVISPESIIPVDFVKQCAHYMTPVTNLIKEDCQVWQDLRMSLIQTYHTKNPNLSQDIDAYRVMLINSAAKYANATADFEKHPLKHWKIIALSQRRVRRMWININKILTQCNSRYFTNQIACVGLDVENLPTNFTSVSSNQHLTVIEEQFVLYQSINALIGIHGSQLTQGILMPPGSVMVELFQWIPKDWGYTFYGDGWTNQKNHPTPMGIMWHNTDIHEAGWDLPRESVPLCENVSDSKIHNFSSTPDHFSQRYWKEQKRSGDAGNATELEYCLAVKYGEKFRWDYRNFNVGPDFLEKFIDTFYPSRSNITMTNMTEVIASESEVPSCDEWREKGEGNGFVLYNLVCKGENGTVKPHHYYQSRR